MIAENISLGSFRSPQKEIIDELTRWEGRYQMHEFFQALIFLCTLRQIDRRSISYDLS